MRVSLIHLFLAFFCSVAVAKPEVFQLQKKQTLLFLSEANYFSTKANYDSAGGSYSDLADGGTYNNLLIDVGGQYAFTQRFYWGAELGVSNAESTSAGLTRTNSTLGEVKTWAQYVAPVKAFRLVPELIFIYPMNRVDAAADEVLTGEGAMALQGGFWATKPFRKFELFSYLGGKYQDEDRASLAVYRIGAHMVFGRFFAGTSFNGYEVLMDDKTSPGARTAVTSRVNARSFRYYSFNPSLMEIDLWTGMRFSRTAQLRLGLSQTINGESSAHGMTIHAAYQFQLFDFSQAQRTGSPSNPEFELHTEEYDESLFQKPKPVQPRRQRRPKEPPAPTQEQLLDETIDELENL